MITFDVYAISTDAKKSWATIFVRESGDVEYEVSQLRQAIRREFGEGAYYMIIRSPLQSVGNMADLEVTINEAVSLGRLTSSDVELDAAIILSEKENIDGVLYPSYEAVEAVLRRFRVARAREVQKGEKTASEAAQMLLGGFYGWAVHANVWLGEECDYVAQDRSSIVAYLESLPDDAPIGWLENEGTVYLG